MALALAITKPRSVERGRNTTLTLTVTDTLTGTVQTPSAATVAIYDGSSQILGATAATTLGAGGYSATYSLSAATIPATIRLTDQWLEVWVVTIGGVEYEFQITGYLCRRAYHPTLTDTDLIALHPQLSSIRPPGYTTYGTWLDEASAWVETRLIQQGRRPELVFDVWSLRYAHLYYALSLIFRALSSSVGAGRYADLAAEYDEKAHDEMRRLKFRYDKDQTGTVDYPEQETQNAPIVITSAPTRRYGWWA